MAEIERRPARTTDRWYAARSLSLRPPLVSTGFALSLRPPLPLPALIAHVESVVPRLVEFHPWLGARVEGWEGDGKGEVEMLLREETGQGAVRVVQGGEGGIDDVLQLALESPISLKGRLWEVFVCLPTPDAMVVSTLYIGLTTHHLLADGLSTMRVTRTLLLLLNTPSLPLPSPPPAPHLPTPIDTLLDIRPGLQDIGKAVFKAYVEPWFPSALRALYTPRSSTTPFLGSPPSEPARQHHLTYFVPLSTLGPLLALARAQGTTLTALLHTAVVLALLPLVPEGRHVNSSTPASLLPLLLAVPQDGSAGGVYVAPLPYTHSSTLPSKPTTLADFLALSQPYSAVLRDKTALRAGSRQWGLTGLLSFSALVTYHASPQNASDRRTFSLSNLRACRFSRSDISGGWVPGQAWFTQTLRGSGAVLCVDVVSVASGASGEGEGEGGMSVILGWEEGVLSAEEVRGVREGVEEWVGWLARQGEEGH